MELEYLKTQSGNEADKVTKLPYLPLSFKIPDYILNDLCARFILNIPDGEEKKNYIRILFQIELAHWYYLDFVCENFKDAHTVGLREFCYQIFLHCPTLKHLSYKIDQILEEWKAYKIGVPTYGAMLIDHSLKNILLVQGFWSKATWGFPKGKINQEESPKDCAIREVFEETGFDISSKIHDNDYIETNIRGQTARLYIIRDVSKTIKFEPQTRKEIKNVRWFRIDQLPINRKDTNCKSQTDLGPNSFFTVIPFVKLIKNWIQSFIQSGHAPDPIIAKVKHQSINNTNFYPECWKNFKIDIDSLYDF